MKDLAPNIPEVVAEVRELFERYERALIDKNVEVLDATFWNSPYTIRWTPVEHGYGFDEIHAQRVRRPPGPGTKEKRHRLDIVTIGRDGYVEIQDRAKDLVKSGGEWISTVALENALMGHPAVAEAAVIAVPDEKWAERPLGVVVLREGASVTDAELRDHLAPQFAKFWLPDRFEYVDEIPKTAVGKFRKTALRERFSTAVAAEQR